MPRHTDDSTGEGTVAKPASLSLDRLRSRPDLDEAIATPALDHVMEELRVRADPGRVVSGAATLWPWGEYARMRAKARGLALDARLDVFRDDLRAIRIAKEVLSRAATMRAVEAAEAAIFEIRTRGETVRLAILNRAQLEMTRLFVQQLEMLDGFRGRLVPEILDAVKQRALEEYTERMNRASKADVEFNRADIIRLNVKP